MTSQPARKSGYTLVEALLAIAISVPVVLVLVSIFNATYKTYSIETARAQLALQDDGAVRRLDRLISQALSVSASHGSYTTGGGTLVLQLPSVDVNQKIIPVTYDYVIYQVDPVNPTKLLEISQVDAASHRTAGSRAVVNHLSSITFRYYDSTGSQLGSNYANAKRVGFSLTTSQTNYKQPVSHQTDWLTTLRNK